MKTKKIISINLAFTLLYTLGSILVYYFTNSKAILPAVITTGIILNIALFIYTTIRFRPKPPIEIQKEMIKEEFLKQNFGGEENVAG